MCRSRWIWSACGRTRGRSALSTGVPVIAVVKADAYGLGAVAVARAIEKLVEGFYVFEASEALAAGLHQLSGTYTIALLGGLGVHDSIRPVVWTLEQAPAAKGRAVVVSVDTGQQRFGCPAVKLDALLSAVDSHEAMTHASTAEQAALFAEVLESRGGRARFRRHAAGSALLGNPAARFDAVRPGIALYQDAVTVTAPLVHAADSTGPAGYTGFVVPRLGVILAGYSHGLRVGPCRVNGAPRRLLEVGMQSSFVEIGPGDRVGDAVELLSPALAPQAVARSWGVTPQAALVSLARCGVRHYLHE